MRSPAILAVMSEKPKPLISKYARLTNIGAKLILTVSSET